MKWLILAILLAGCTTTIPHETGSIQLFFCERTNCTQQLNNYTQDKYCALYRVSEDINISEKNLVIDGGMPITGAVVEKGKGLMHNKFCVFGNRVWTGSWNPTQKMKIPNNAVVIESKTIAAAYRREYDEMQHGTFHGGKQGPAKAYLNESLVEAYFCPEDDCKKQVLRTIKNAKKHIRFMTYSFTDDDIGDEVLKKAQEGLDVKGLFDPRSNQRWSEYTKLKEFSKKLPVHHKVFIADDTVITGSYNPTLNGNERNDENILIIHDKNIASQYMEEFTYLMKPYLVNNSFKR